jgi:hypothetical protein
MEQLQIVSRIKGEVEELDHSNQKKKYLENTNRTHKASMTPWKKQTYKSWV